MLRFEQYNEQYIERQYIERKRLRLSLAPNPAGSVPAVAGPYGARLVP